MNYYILNYTLKLLTYLFKLLEFLIIKTIHYIHITNKDKLLLLNVFFRLYRNIFGYFVQFQMQQPYLSNNFFS